MHYASLPKFDSEKPHIVARFLKDKTCKWFGQYQKEKTSSKANTDKVLCGSGTMCPTSNCFYISFTGDCFSCRVCSLGGAPLVLNSTIPYP